MTDRQTTHVVIGNATLYLGDCLEVLRTLPDASVDSIVCDPPYGLSKEPDMAEVLRHWMAGDDYQHKGGGFMGKTWDSFVPGPSVWKECLRVLKPGGHLLAFFGTRTQDMGTLAIRLAGFEIRDSIAWVYGSGFPKSLDVSKAIDKAAGAEREVLGVDPVRFARLKNQINGSVSTGEQWEHGGRDVTITAPATDAARRWQGWGTALKPALEPITVARKPLIGTVAANVLAHGTGALNIDGCRVGYLPDERVQTFWNNRGRATINASEGQGAKPRTGEDAYDPSKGRWPANLIHDGSEEVLAGFPTQKSPAPYVRSTDDPSEYVGLSGTIRKAGDIVPGYGDTGSAARFFYCAKASKRDREEGLEHMEAVHRPNGNKWTDQDYRVARGERPPSAESGPRKNIHPTVKPTDLMRYLCRLVTPPGGIVLDHFMGSGSTGKAAMLEGFRFIGIEREPKYFDIARARIEDAQHHG